MKGEDGKERKEREMKIILLYKAVLLFCGILSI